MCSIQRLPSLKALYAAALLCVIFFSSANANQQEQAPPPTVGVVTLKAKTLPVMSELPGRVGATRIAEVRARVSGILQERVFMQGSQVKEGDVLYRVDPRLFRVRVASAQAGLQRAEATKANTVQQLERQRILRQRQVGSQAEFDTAAVAVAQAEADVALAEAALDEAKINLDYTEVKAPISGIIGGALVTEGALVTADGTSNLALIQQVDPVYVDFTQSVQQLIDLRRAVASGELANSAPGEARVELVFDDSSVYKHPGRLLFANANVDPNTGQVMLRADFPNKNGELLPGMYVRVRIEQALQVNAITVPQRSIIRDDVGKAQIYVLNSDDVAEIRDITLGQAIGSEWVVDAGLRDGETIIADAVQKVQPGAKVVHEPWLSGHNKTEGHSTPSDQPAE